MANNNTTLNDFSDLLESYDNVDLSKGILGVNNDQAKSLNNIYAAYKAMREKQESISPRTRDWLRDNYGIVGESQDEIEEQIAILKELGQGKSKGMQRLEGAKAGADIGSKLAQLLPETKETLAAGPRGFGVVGRK